MNQGTLYPLPVETGTRRLRTSEWGASDNNHARRASTDLHGAARAQLQTEARDWNKTAAIIGRFFEVKAEDFLQSL